jgi:hypothetical protein
MFSENSYITPVLVSQQWLMEENNLSDEPSVLVQIK